MKRWMPLFFVIVAQVFFGVMVVRVSELSMWWQWSVIGTLAMACIASFTVGRITGQERAQVQSALLCFYAAYSIWLHYGAPEGGVFYRKYGLCSNAYEYCKHMGLPKWAGRAVWNALQRDFKRAGLDTNYPFNADDMSYSAESYRRACHENPARIKWVRDQLQQLTE